MAAGGYPPAAPTEPDVPNSGIRFLGLGIRCATVNAVNHTRRGKRVVLKQPLELLPVHVRAVARTTAEPRAPEPFDLSAETIERTPVAGDTVVAVVTLQLAV